ncbi:MAG: substrate-binding domain-containing protein [Desulfuromonadaceae bacterium]|nr:substrate-binding domain-containing protein [Desulfuromonadaceae bacterium]MDD2855098.1 substrate-binding domain-containing protein [Desulfuromonadaceae bacterium]
MKIRELLTGLVAIAATLMCSPAGAEDSFVAEAKRHTALVSRPNPPWDGPSTGPRARKGKYVIYVSNDQRNGGARGVGLGAAEAAKAIGWNFRLIDGQGTEQGRRDALKQAADLKPDGIILGTVDAQNQAEVIREIAAKGIKIVGWHSAGRPGPISNLPIVTNISTDPVEVGRAAAMYAVADSNGTAGVVIFRGVTPLSTVKANAMIETIRKCQGCSVLQVKTMDLKDTHSAMPQFTALLLQNYGKKWTYSIGINDLYFDAMSPSLIAAAIPGNGYPRNISAGDGSETAFERIRKKRYQIGTVAEPLRLHGWQAVDELNRAFAGEKWSGYTAPVHLITAANITHDGGNQNEYDPDNGYRNIYRKIWGVK